MRLLPPVALALGLALVSALPAGAQVEAPTARLTAIPEVRATTPGGRFRVAVRIAIPQGWHLGWVNPGGSGLPTTLTWSGDGVLADGPTEFPYPTSTTGGRSVSHVYRGVVVLFSPLRVDGSRRRGRVDLTGTLSWGMCTDVVCVPQQRTVYTSVEVGERRSANPGWAAVDSARRYVPRRLPSSAVKATLSRDTVRLVLTGTGYSPGPATFFPLDPARTAVAVGARPGRGGVSVALPSALLAATPPARLAGVLVPSDAPRSRALLVDVPVIR